jgi:ParB family chromosome partitioning protein
VKTQKAILRDFIVGENGRPRVEAWTPRWMAFPPQPYTRRPFAPAVRGRSAAALLRRSRSPAEASQAIAAE